MLAQPSLSLNGRFATMVAALPSFNAAYGCWLDSLFLQYYIAYSCNNIWYNETLHRIYFRGTLQFLNPLFFPSS